MADLIDRNSLNEAPDYDAGLLNDYGGGNVEWWQDYLRAEIGRANEFWRDAIAALPAQGVRVKPLVWEPRTMPNGGAGFDAFTSIGQYVVADEGWFLRGGTTWQGNSDGIDAAIAAAQADYERRILAAIREIPSESGEGRG